MKRRDIKIYTDGACTQGAFMPFPGGYSAVMIDEMNKEHVKTGNKFHTTNNEMELTGFLEGLKMALDYLSIKTLKHNVDIFTDSAYIYNCFNQKWYEKWFVNNWTTSSKEEVKNKNLWVEIFDVIKELKKLTNNLNIQKVKAHENDYYNNMADRLAVEAKEKVVKENENYSINR